MATTNSNFSNAGLLPSGVLQPYGQNILKYGIGQLGTPIDVGALTPKVAGQTAFQQQAQQGIANQSGLGDVQRDASGQVTGFTGGTGVASYQPYLNQMSQFNTAAEGLADPSQDYQAFMSPYQQEVINTTMADFDRQAQIGSGQVGMNAYTAGAFGGSRQGVAEAEYQSSSDRNRAALLAGLYGQGYDQAQGYRQQAMTNQLGLGSLQQGLASFVPGMEQQNLAALSAVGQQDQLLEQSKLNAMAQANQSAYQLPLDRITDVANIYGTVSGAMPGSPTQKFAPNPLLTGIGGFANMYTTLGGSAMTRGGGYNQNAVNAGILSNQDDR
jgi:hypothetical protein